MGEIAALTAAFLWSITSLLFARVSHRASASILNFYTCTTAFVLLIPTLIAINLYQNKNIWIDFQILSTTDYAIIAISAFLGLTVADTAYFRAIRHLGSAHTMIFTTLVPVFTAIFAGLFLDEHLTIPMGMGMLCTSVGIGWVLWSKRAPPEVPSEVSPPKTTQKIDGVGVLFVMLYVTSQAASNVILKDVNPALPTLPLSLLRLGVGSMLILLPIFWQSRRRSSNDVVGRQAFVTFWQDTSTRNVVLFASFLGTYMSIWISLYALRTIHAGIATSLSSTMPLFSLPLAHVFLHERMTWKTFAGACVAVLGVSVLLLSSSN